MHLYLSPPGLDLQRPPISEPLTKGLIPHSQGLQSAAAQSTIDSMQDSKNKWFNGQDFLNQARGNHDKKPGIFRQGSLGQDPQGQHNRQSSNTSSLGGAGPPGLIQEKLGPQAGQQPQVWPATQGTLAPTSQGITVPATRPSGGQSQTSKFIKCHSPGLARC